MKIYAVTRRGEWIQASAFACGWEHPVDYFDEAGNPVEILTADNRPIPPHVKWYVDRLADQSLLTSAVEINDNGDMYICVPIGGSRLGGFESFRTLRLCREAIRLLRGKEGFPNVRIEKGGRDVCHIVRWGDPEPGWEESDAAHGLYYGYSDRAIGEFIKWRESIEEQRETEEVK